MEVFFGEKVIKIRRDYIMGIGLFVIVRIRIVIFVISYWINNDFVYKSIFFYYWIIFMSEMNDFFIVYVDFCEIRNRDIVLFKDLEN